ncbi:hypothetical protein ABVT39_006927 [Epinephelus coioides]
MEKYTFIEKCRNPYSVTLLVKGPNKHTLTQIINAVRDGLQASKNAIVSGPDAFEVTVVEALVKPKPTVKGRAQLGAQALAVALLNGMNSSYDPQETLLKLQTEYKERGQLVGVDLSTGKPWWQEKQVFWDNYSVKKQLLHSCMVECLLSKVKGRLGKLQLLSYTQG